MSQAHLTWTATNSSRIGFGNDPVYVKTRCFDPFPFPDCTPAQQQTIRDIAERLDAHRKRQQQLHPWLTLTEMYKVLEKLRALDRPGDGQVPQGFSLGSHNAQKSDGALAPGFALTESDHSIYNAALIGILRELHDDLDRAVFDAYGWPESPTALTTEQILERIVALNAARRAEEDSGLVRWLRPEYQAPTYVPTTATLEGLTEETTAITRRKQPWPATIPDQFRVVKDALRSNPLQTADQVAANFRNARRTRTQEILETLTVLGQVRESSGRYTL